MTLIPKEIPAYGCSECRKACKHLEVVNNLPHGILIQQVAAEEARPSASVSTPQRFPVVVLELLVDGTSKKTSGSGHQYTAV